LQAPAVPKPLPLPPQSPSLPRRLDAPALPPLESAIDRVETVYSKHDHLRVLQSRDRLTNSSEVDASEITIEGRKSALIIRPPSLHTHLPSFSTGVVDDWRKAKPSWHWMGAAPLARAAVVFILAVLLCAALYRQFGFFGRQAPQPFTSATKLRDRKRNRLSKRPRTTFSCQ
jgi:hypothetical protein